MIVGAGSAGCVLADRLSADGSRRVLLLEYGGSDRSIFIQMPSALPIPMNRRSTTGSIDTEPEPDLDGAAHAHAARQGARRLLVDQRPGLHPRQPARLRALGGARARRGWGYADVLPYFRRAETRAEGGDDYRGGDGPLGTCYGTARTRCTRPGSRPRAQAGYPLTADVNGYQQEGFGPHGHDRRPGPALQRRQRLPAAGDRRGPTSTVQTDALATRILFEGRPRGRRRVRARAATSCTARARARGDPLRRRDQLAAAAEALGHRRRRRSCAEHRHRRSCTTCRASGENLQDHLEFYFQVACKEPITLYSAHEPAAPSSLIGARWLLLKDGLGATNHFETCGFIRSRAGIQYPDIQYHFLPMAVSYDGSSLAKEHGFQAHVGPMRSKSRGWVRLRSPDPRDKPRILFNYMSHPDDWVEMRACVRLTREIFAQPRLRSVPRPRDLQPGAEVATDEQIDAFIRAKVESAYHPSCTCKMGAADDPLAVVDPETRVHGIEGLRVVDSSIMPSVTTAISTRRRS